MRDARLVGLSEDGRSLVLAVDGPQERLQLPIDDRLRRLLPARSDGPTTTAGRTAAASSGPHLEIEMTSALRPRDIQARIRSGETAEQVAQAAQLPVERIMAFAAPVLAERAHVAEVALRGTVRRTGDGPVRSLGEWIDDRFAERGVDAKSADWDAWRDDRGQWQVRLDYRSGDRPHRATFGYDPAGRVVTATDDEARWLVGESSTRRGPQPRGRRLSAVPHPADAEDTDEVVRSTTSRRKQGEPDLFSSLGADETSQAVDATASTDLPETDELDDIDDIDDIDDNDDDVAGEQVVDGEVPGEVVARTGSDDQPDTNSGTDDEDDDQRRRFGRRSAPKPKRPSVPSWDEIMFGRKSD